MSRPDHELERASTTGGIPVSPALGTALELEHVPPQPPLVDGRVLWLCALAIGVALVAAIVAQALIHLIAFFTHLAFHGTLSLSVDGATPRGHHLGAWVIVVPVIGGLIVGLMARFGSAAIRGHGIPEAMEQVLLNKSRIPPRMTFLKPLSSAIAIGTGGPFGAEGPIIATGGALGSVLGQVLHITAAERKTLLAAGAAAGMSATFGAPVSAALIAVELLLFEFRPRSLIPVALATVVAAAVRTTFEGGAPAFAMAPIAQPGGVAIALYLAIGAIMGVASVLVTRTVYAIEDAFDRLPIHWMWWPAIGGLAVGLVGYFEPRTLGVGYENITDLLTGHLTLGVIASLCVLKFISWSISLGSGTSGGTLAPLFTIGGALGALLGFGAAALVPAAAVDVRIAALVGMAAIFAGASRALLTSAVFVFETTLQPLGLMPLLGGCAASFLVSCLMMRHSIMTEKIARRGVRVPTEYLADFLDRVLVRQMATQPVVSLRSEQTLEEVRAWIAGEGPERAHQGYPIVDSAGGFLVGVLTRRDLLDPKHPPPTRLASLIRRRPSVIYDDCTLREAANHMTNHDIGRLPVMRREEPAKLIGIITRADLLRAHRLRLEEHEVASIEIPLVKPSTR